MTATTRPVPTTTIFRRPKVKTGLLGWLTTVDHKKIGIMYGYTAFVFFIVGGVEALLLRIQLVGGRHLPDRGSIQRHVHHARHHDDLPLRDARRGRLLQLPPSS